MIYLVIVILAFGAIAYVSCKIESLQWNNGVCKASGEKWSAFDSDSSGATGYQDGKGNLMWRSWE